MVLENILQRHFLCYLAHTKSSQDKQLSYWKITFYIPVVYEYSNCTYSLTDLTDTYPRTCSGGILDIFNKAIVAVNGEFEYSCRFVVKYFLCIV